MSPHSSSVYKPTLTEIGITAASFIIVLLIITLLSKIFPIIPVWEMKEEASQNSK